jgi:hypothetical protein
MTVYIDNALGNRDFGVAVSHGTVEGYSTINKYGQALDCDNGVDTDIWDGADGVTSTDIWVAPTTARVHDLVSASANDDGDPVGTGMRTVKVCGLTGWGAAETSEIVTLNGTSNVATANSYVIIHRMIGQTFGSGGTNAGIITATAQTDGTITAAIQAAEGQTLMAIYGIPSTQRLHIVYLRTGVLLAAGAEGDITLLVKQNADQSDAGFVTRERGEFSDSSPFSRRYGVPKAIEGPAIAKVQVKTNTNGCVVSAVFDGYLVDH